MPSPRHPSARVEALLQNASEPLFLVNSDRRLTFVNRAWEQLTGHPASVVQGTPCVSAGPVRPGEASSLAGSFCPPSEAFAGQACSVLTLIYHAEGERLWRRIEFLPLHGDPQAPPSILGLVRGEQTPPIHPPAEDTRLRVALLEARHRLAASFGLENLVGSGPRHWRLIHQIRAAAACDSPVVIIGEPGTGKRQVARTIHLLGSRRSSAFLAFDCAAVPIEILQGELFARRAEARDPEDPAGTAVPTELRTVLMVELLSLPRDLQATLALSVDGPNRWIATTSEELEPALRQGRLRDDVFYRFTSIEIRLAPLRERRNDLELLAQNFLERANLRVPRQRFGFTDSALDVLHAYDWPGNLRELARVIEDAHGRGSGDVIDAADLTPEIRGQRGGAFPPPAPVPVGVTLDERLMLIERRLIEEALRKARQNKSRAAELLGISRPRLYRRIKELGIPDEPDGAEES